MAAHDDSHSDVKQIAGQTFDVSARYQLLKRLGEGSYGIVVSARDKLTNKKVAIKKMVDVIEETQDAKRVLRELKLLRHFRVHENVISIKDILLSPAPKASFKDIYVVTDLMDTDLHRIIRSPQPLSDDHTRYFMYQILRGLKYMHSASVIHRDLKPNNLLVNANCDLKICDLGLARVSTHPAKSMLTCYVVTRWYRAPELLLGTKNYTSAIDMWSVGCILAELLGRKALFQGKDYLEMLRMIVSVVGTPAAEDYTFASEKAIAFIMQMEKRQKQSLDKMFPSASPQAIDLLTKLLVFDPKKRLTAEQALEHPYMQELHDPEDEPCCAQVFDFGFEKEATSLDEYRDLIWSEYEYFQRKQATAERGAGASAAAHAATKAH
jgi:serine/threonine protein kinase